MRLPLLIASACLFAMPLFAQFQPAPKEIEAKLKVAYGYGVFTYGMY